MTKPRKNAAMRVTKDNPSIAEAKRVLEVEAAAILGLIDHLDNTFVEVVELINASNGRVITMGLGKSGIICKKISATLASTGTPSFFLHPAEEFLPFRQCPRYYCNRLATIHPTAFPGARLFFAGRPRN